MKVIFLDFDGVLNSEKWMKERQDTVDPHAVAAQYPFYEIDPASVCELNRIIDATGAKVVVSSTWRHGRSCEELTSILKFHGFEGEIIDATPSIGYFKEYHIPRGCEIEWWVENKGKFKRINWSIAKQREYIAEAIVKNYVILDDDSDMLLSQREHFVKTSWKDGLTPELANKAIEILNTPVEKLYYDIDWKNYDENLS